MGLRIAVNARMLSQWKPGGIAEFSRQTLRRITRSHPEHDFLFIVDRPFPGRGGFPDNVSVARTIPSFHPLLWHPWFEIAVPAILRRWRPDLFLSTDGFMSLSAGVPAAIVIHDLGFHHNPKDMPLLHRIYLNRFFPRYARQALILATPTEHSRRDIAESYGIDPGKIGVVYGAAGDGFRPLSPEDGDAVRREIAGGAPYFLYVGLLHPRKNLVRLLRAFDRFRRGRGEAVKLVLAGPVLFKTGEIFRTWKDMSFRDDVLFLGEVSPKRLSRLYGAAFALLYVSLYEGFGLPLLEAMACGTPVIASDRTSIPEVCGGAARLADPESVEAISGAMEALFADPGTRRDLAERGRARQAEFSWDRTARLLWESIERGLG